MSHIFLFAHTNYSSKLPTSPITKLPNGPLDAVLPTIAQRIGGTHAQVIFKWVLAKGAVVVTTSSKRERDAEYLAVASLRTYLSSPPLLFVVRWLRFWVSGQLI